MFEFLLGCTAWQWFYPYHYAPFASDIADPGSVEISLPEGKPFRPFEQLLSVLPAERYDTRTECLLPVIDVECQSLTLDIISLVP